MAAKLTETQHGLLTIICEGTTHEGDSTDNPVIRHWLPPHRKSQYSPTLKRDVIVSGAGDAACLKGMARKGWIVSGKLEYSYAITEEGRLILEQHREATGFYEGRLRPGHPK